MTERETVLNKALKTTGMRLNPRRFKIVTDTSDWLRINRGDAIKIGGKYYLVKGNMREPRFGIDDQPKYWVFSATDIDSGEEKILKTVFNEEFYAHIGILRVRCYRDVDKESRVIDFTHGDERFMQGESCLDEKGNNVRIIDYIHGDSFFTFVPNITKSHEQYFHENLPEILHKLKTSIYAIKFLHDSGFCHGDIRNDHILIETKSKRYVWIDFDLKQDVSDFDLWSIGNILSYAAAKGIITFDRALKSKDFPDSVKRSLTSDDGSAFYNYRIINLKKVYPILPDSLANILMHFAVKPISYYSKIDELLSDYEEMLDKDFPLK